MTTPNQDVRGEDQEPTLANQLGLDRLVDEAEDLGRALAHRGVSSIGKSIDSLTDRLTAVAGGDGVGGAAMKATKAGPVGKAKLKAGKELVKETAAAAGHGTTDQAKQGMSSIKDKITGVFKGGSDSGGDKKLKVTNIVESVDVPVDRAKAYQLWTQFEDFPTFMKKVESVKQKSDATVEWTAQILWSHRSWTAEIQEQVPNEKIVWQSSGEKGHVNGAVTFHELAPNLTRVLVTLEYHPRGLFEHTGNIWRAQGRRARLELKHYRRHVASQTLLNPEDVEGWPGEIHEGEVQSSGRGRSSKSSGSGGSTSKKSTSKKSASKKSASKKSASKKSTPSTRSSGGGGSGSNSAKKTASRKKTAASRNSSRKNAQSSASTAKKSTPKKSTAKKSTARKRTSAKR